VAFDAPLIVVNPSGQRPCERLVAQYFGRYGARCHPTNTANPSFTAGARGLRLAETLGLELDPAIPSARRAAEVYPHPALVVLFDLPRILQYKAKPGRDFTHLQAELLRLIGYLESLAHASPPLQLKGNPQWDQIRAGAESAWRKADLKRLEDAVDGVVCAYIAAYADANPSLVHYLGDVGTGQILTPITPAIAAHLSNTSASLFPQAGPLTLSGAAPPRSRGG
jgi:predicted RNase H-like nuclease